MAEASVGTKRGCGFWVLAALAVVGGLSLLGSLVPDPDGESPSAVAGEGLPDLPVTPEELRAAYDANEAAAQQQFGGRMLRVTGKVSAITLDIGDDPVIEMETAERFQEVNANLAESDAGMAAALRKGQDIVLRCAGVSEVVGTPILRDCTIG